MKLSEFTDLVIYIGALAAAVAAITALLCLAARIFVLPAARLWLDQRLDPLRTSSSATEQGIGRLEYKLDDLTATVAENRRTALNAQRLAIEALSTARAAR